MAIGTSLAIGLGAAGIVGGSLLGSSSANKASKRAAGVAQDTADQNNALARDIYAQNTQTLSPYVNAGIPATQNINALLGLQSAAPRQAPAQQGNGTGVGLFDSQFGGQGAQSPFQQWAVSNGLSPQLSQQPASAAAPAPAQPGMTPQQAFANYQDSTGYQFRVSEGENALRGGFSGAGTLQSGAALKALQEHGQGMASQEFGNYMGLLQGQQALGAGAASAQAGVATNFGNTISANNNSAGTAAANAALSKQNGFSNALGLVGGGLFGYGMK